MKNEYILQPRSDEPGSLVLFDCEGKYVSDLNLTNPAAFIEYTYGPEDSRAATAFIDGNGFDADMPDGGAEFKTYVDVVDPYNEDQMELAKAVGATHRAFCYEVVDAVDGPILQSTEEHTVLGKLGLDGSFEPIVTSLEF